MVADMTEDSRLRIGELSRRSGASPELLRAWERRYGLVKPTRSAGGLRLYSVEDLERVRLMRQYLAQGIAAAEAAALAAGASASTASDGPVLDATTARDQLARMLEDFDEPGAQMVIDLLLAVATIDTLLRDVVLPHLKDLGDRWERGELSVAQEHFASNVLRGRLLGLARGWGRGLGPRVLLACPPGERHDLGLLAFGLALHSRGWRIDYLGSDTPMDSIAQAARSLDPALLVLSAVTAERLRPLKAELKALAERHRLALAGAALQDYDTSGLDVLRLTGDPVAAAEHVTESWQADGSWSSGSSAKRETR